MHARRHARLTSLCRDCPQIENSSGGKTRHQAHARAAVARSRCLAARCRLGTTRSAQRHSCFVFRGSEVNWQSALCTGKASGLSGLPAPPSRERARCPPEQQTATQADGAPPRHGTARATRTRNTGVSLWDIRHTHAAGMKRCGIARQSPAFVRRAPSASSATSGSHARVPDLARTVQQ